MQAVVTYESGKKSGDLPPELHRLGKALARGSNFKALADAAMESPNLKEAIKGRICSDISKECKRLCSKADPSLLRGMTKEAMVNFSWQAVGKELQTKAPLFLRCILAAADPANGTATTYDAVRHPGVYTAAAILLKKRDKAISLIPYVISTILKVGKTSKTVNLGVIFKDENLGEEMIDIIRGLHGMVPTVEGPGGQEKFDRVPVVGDQKTMERGVEAQFSVRNAYTKSRRLEGLFFQLADWHHENKFLALIFSRYYSGSSACDKTSLFALRNLVNWRDVITDAQQKPAPCKRFVDLILDADIIAAALVFFGMVDVDATPTKHGFSNEMVNNIRAVRARYFSRVVIEFILTFIVDGTLYERHFANIQALEEWEAFQRNQPVLENGRFPCRFPGCDSSFKHDGVHRMRHELSHNPPPRVPAEPTLESTLPDPSDQNPEPKDDVFDYHCGFMNMALLLRNFRDAIKEGDGDRIINCIKMFLLHFKQDGSGSTKYALEALYHLFQVLAILSPRETERLKWNRTVNNQGGDGNNVAMDVALEHDNHALKEIIRGLGANITEDSVRRVCRAFFILKKLLFVLDTEVNVKKVSGRHTKKSVKEDLIKVVKTLSDQHVFEKQTTREPMYCFPDCPRDYLQLLNTKELFRWINDHKTNISLEKRPR